MFERSKKDGDNIDSQDANRTGSDTTLGSLRSKVTGRSGDAAVIGRSIQIIGDLRGGEDLRIEGDVSGTVELKDNALTIGKEGKVKADVYARSIAVDGEIKGDLYAAERISVHINARVQGNIIAPKVSIEEGAHFKGSIEMDPNTVEKALGKAAASSVDKSATENKPSRSADAKSAAKKPAKDGHTNLNPPAGNA
ncbi:MAG: polymer-forming cytoskeletal protein [Woeseia sp.]|nr:polymer-forming cytoskeletal protein [Woeseia sp.]